eukprot:45089-Amphidinium_carterae.1
MRHCHNSTSKSHNVILSCVSRTDSISHQVSEHAILSSLGLWLRVLGADLGTEMQYVSVQMVLGGSVWSAHEMLRRTKEGLRLTW